MVRTSRDGSDRDTLYVLVTGANSGLGLAICLRIITNFLLTRPSSQHLHLIPSTRSKSKADATIHQLKDHVNELTKGEYAPLPFFRSQPSQQYTPPSKEERALFSSRVTYGTVLLDLCSLKSIYEAANQLSESIPRLDILINNAGIGGWTGIDWLGVFKQLFTKGIKHLVERPEYKIGPVGSLVKPQLGMATNEESKEPALAEVFCANVFGHYLLTHELLPLLSREENTDGAPRGRVVWTSSEQADHYYLKLDDLQGLESFAAYESSKRLTDLMILGHNSQEVKPFLQSYLNTPKVHEAPAPEGLDKSMVFVTKSDASSSPTSERSEQNRTPPLFLLSHPGIAVTNIFPLPIILVWIQTAIFYIARFIGSKWHVISTDKGATASVWLALESDEVLERENAERIKWGSSSDRWGKEGVSPTDVDAYGESGEKDKKGDLLRTSAHIWESMEDLRKEWEGLVKN